MQNKQLINQFGNAHTRVAVSAEEEQDHFDNFFEDVFVECEDKYGTVEEMNICDNLGDHLVGNVYIKVCTPQYKSGLCSVWVYLARLNTDSKLEINFLCLTVPAR